MLIFSFIFSFSLSCSKSDKEDLVQDETNKENEESEEELLNSPYGDRLNLNVEGASLGQDVPCLNVGTIKCRESLKNQEPHPEVLNDKPLIMKKVGNSEFRLLWSYTEDNKKYIDFSLNDPENKEIQIYNPLPSAPKFFSESFVEFFPVGPIIFRNDKGKIKSDKQAFVIAESSFYKKRNSEEDELPYLLPPLRYDFLGEVKNYYTDLIANQCDLMSKFFKAQRESDVLNTIIMPSLISMVNCSCETSKSLNQDERFSKVDSQTICMSLNFLDIANMNTIIAEADPTGSNTINKNELGNIAFWRPIPYPGYTCLGDVVTSGFRPVPDNEDDHVQGLDKLYEQYGNNLSQSHLGYYASYCVKSEFTKQVMIGSSLEKNIIIDKTKITSGQFKNNIYSLSYKVKNDLDEDIFDGSYNFLYFNDKNDIDTEEIKVLDESYVNLLQD